MVHHWSKAINDGQSAFDHVDYNVLVGLLDTVIRWMCAFLTCRRQRVKIGKVFLEWLKTDAGMAQGSFLGPLTFVILTDDL